MRIFGLLAGLVVLIVGGPASAWDDQGHMMVAALAYDQLSAGTRTRVAQLLSLNQYPANNVSDHGAGDPAKAAFVMAATGADAIKADAARNAGSHFIDDGENPVHSRDAGRNDGFADKFVHRYWHFTDVPFSSDGSRLLEPPTVNIQERIALFRQTLASNASDQLKAYDLVWLLHLVGDIHQPLHVTQRFTRDTPNGDRGGTAVRLCSDATCHENLHAYWDQLVGKSRDVAAAIAAARELPPADERRAAQRDEAIWVREGFEIAQTVVYARPIGPGSGPFTLDDSYRMNARKVARERIALAGARLARLLNTELK
jgi:hypothetical protein